MGMDESEDAKGGMGQQRPSEPESSPPAAEGDEEKSSRVDAAKAFFRAMYAGEEPPSSFGKDAPQAAPADATTKTACRKCESLELQAKELEQKTAEAETLYKRMAADFDNYRRRMEREREESVGLGVKKAAEGLLPALDDLGRAMQFLSPDTPSDKVIDSFKLVANRISQCLEQVGVKKIEAVGQLFDPKFHEPVQQIETTEFADGVVMQELRAGYVLGERVVRPSLVNVASNSSGVVTQPMDATEATLSTTFIDSGDATSGESTTAIDPTELEHTVATATVPEGVYEDDSNTRVYELEDSD